MTSMSWPANMANKKKINKKRDLNFDWLILTHMIVIVQFDFTIQ